ncbi:MAG: methionine--tRNA ligase [Candidatus Marinimicrobia bacterium]|nr:methionine--tRNA ligase [Candidatus Neomarinimicrobiota bacterium]|tara:strand:+ start:3210 stop:5075 length:1866 start_codon:yes stop_codon:yes gene_type:complete
MSKFYLTTPIYYVNDKPHIGHAYTTILADVLARYHRDSGDEVFFLTGLDEHGQKVQQAAEERGVDPQDHCDKMAPRFLKLWEKLHISNDDFIRTTEKRHAKVVQGILQTVYDNGDVYENEYEGLYSVSEERFITDKEAESGEFRDIKKLKEKNYFFKMSKYQDALIDHIHANPKFIQPDHRKNEVLGFLKQPLGDLCISRPKSRLNWGIDLPFDKDYITYVWFDALINYVTATGFSVNDAGYEKWWPCEVHLIGKDILTTHTVYWPTMLMSAGIPLPKSIFAHGWWLSGESKMSKSLGNVVNPLDLIEEYGVDPVRYYLMREMVLGQDASFTLESFVKRYNSDLANDLGNLVGRVTTLIERHFGGTIPASGQLEDREQELRDMGEALSTVIPDHILSMRLSEAVEETMQYVRAINRYMERTEPWKLVKNNLERAGTVLYNATESLRQALVLLRPIMPVRTEIVLKMIGAEFDKVREPLEEGLPLGEFEIPFPKIEMPEADKKEHQTEEMNMSDEKIAIEDFAKVDLRTAFVIAAEKVEGADKLLKLQLQVGEEERQIVAGIAEHYSPDEMVGRTIAIVANLKPAVIRGVESNGMLLAASGDDSVVVVTLDDPEIGSGIRIS